MRRKSRNLEMLAVVAGGLRRLKEKVAFVGGATIELHIAYPANAEPRPTDDVDCVVELAGRKQYYDIEDIIALLDGCPDAEERIQNAPTDVRSYLAEMFRDFLKNERFVEVIPGHVLDIANAQARAARTLALLRELSTFP